MSQVSHAIILKMPLSELTVRDAKPRERAYKLWDERGLYLFVRAGFANLDRTISGISA
jgi:hypothetical protein